jgi:hypothetical protein
VTSAGIDNGRKRLVAAAAVGKGRTAIEAIVTPVDVPAGQFALFSHEPVEVEPSTLIDSYDSSLGTYSDQLAAGADPWVDEDAVVGSNRWIHVDNSSQVHGDAQPGPGYMVTMDDPSGVSGSTTPSEITLDFDPIVVPALPSSGFLVVGSDDTLVLPSGDYRFSDLYVGTDGKLTIRGPARLVLDDWTLRSNAELVLDTLSGPIEMYVADEVSLRSNSSVVTTGQSAVGMTLFLTGGPDQEVELDSNSEFRGLIYGPLAEVEIHSNFEVFGAVAARRVDLQANVSLHYDEALAGGGVASLTGYRVQSWRPVPFPVPAMRSDRGDPFLLLGVDRDLLDGPGQLHDL